MKCLNDHGTGGLGATFYVSYFNTALIFVLILLLVVEVSRLRPIILISCCDHYDQ
jgi:hypothetical protein